jgi:hypothetical protein
VSRSAFVFCTHHFDAEDERRYLAWRRASQGRGDCFILAPLGTNIPARYCDVSCPFDFERLRRRARSVIAPTMVPGSCHLSALHLYETHPGYDEYWFVEYDVVFTGSWSVLFDAVHGDGSALIACHVRERDEEPSWHWWRSIEHPSGDAPSPLLRAFLPVYRISADGLSALSRAVSAGWVGHFEALVPTVLRAASLTISDFGGDGSYVPPARRNCFYTSFSGREELWHFGTMRFRPCQRSPLLRPNSLYHPVKNEIEGPRLTALRDAWECVRREPRFAFAHLARTFDAWLRLRHELRWSGRNARGRP